MNAAKTACTILLLWLPVAWAQTTAEKERIHEYLKTLSIEDLVEVETRLDETFDVFDGLVKALRVSVATGEEQSMSKAPAVTSVITEQDIEAMGARNLDEVLRAVPGLHVSYNFLDNSIYVLRGLASNDNPEVLILVNGVRLNSSQAGNKASIWFAMPVNAIARIEVMRGPGSAVYGADAFAGVINIITKRADEIDGTEIGTRYGSFDTWDLWVLHGKRYADLELAASLEYAHTDGHGGLIEADAQTALDAVFGTDASHAPGPYRNRYHLHDLRLDLGYRNWRLHTAYHKGEDKGTGPGVVEALDPEGFKDSGRFEANLSYSNPVFTRYWDVSARLSYLRSYWQAHYFLYPPGAMGGSFPDGMLGAPGTKEAHTRLELSGFYSGFNDKHHFLRTGAGYVYDDQFDTGDRANFADGFSSPVDLSDTELVFAPEVARDSWYVFLQDSWRMNPQWELTAGARYDQYSDFGGTLNPRAALVWQPRQSMTAKLLYGRAFRAPSFNELYLRGNPAQGGNPNLKPEQIETWELAFDWRASETLHAELNLFTYEVTDKILYATGTSGSVQQVAQNVGEWESTGAELEVRWKINHRSSLLFNYAYQNAKDKHTRRKLGYSPEHQAYLRADRLLFPGWYLNLQLNRAGAWARHIGDPRTKLDATLSVDLTLRYKNPRKTPWNFALGARNLFDEDVRSPSLGPDANGVINIPGDYPEAGCSYWAEARYAFK